MDDGKDETINHEAIAEIEKIVKDFFKDEKHKVALWFRLKNPLLGNISPNDMIRMGREEKLLRCVRDMIDGNIA